MSKEDESGGKWGPRFKRLFALLPDDYSQAKPLADAISHAFHQEMAAALTPRINAHLQTMPKATYAEARAAATWVNHELHSLRLCLRCPKTGRPAILLADVRSSPDDPPRWRFQARDSKGATTRTLSLSDLPGLELMEDPPRREGLSKWQER